MATGICPWCGKRVDKFIMFRGDIVGCRYCCGIHTKQTNCDRVHAMNAEELAEWYWWMLRYVQGYTDSRVALLDWLKEEAKE